MSTCILTVTQDNVSTVVADCGEAVLTVDSTTILVTAGETGFQGATGSPGGAPDWGDIGGTLTNQTDLQAVLDTKATIEEATALAIALGG